MTSLFFRLFLIQKMIAEAKSFHADYILTGSLTLLGNEFADSKILYYKFLERYDPVLLSKYKPLYAQNFYVPYQYQRQLKEKADKLCKKYTIRNSIVE